MLELNSLIDLVESYNDKDIYYVIAGGSCLDIYNGKDLTQINDIDIYFKSISDFDDFCDILKSIKGVYIIDTQLSSTYIINNIKFQLIRMIFGNSTEIINTFDLYNSRLYIDSNYDSNHNDFIHDKNIKISLENITGNTSSRIEKYIKEKSLTISDIELKKYISFCELNKNNTFNGNYKGGKVFGSYLSEYFFNDEDLGIKEALELYKLYPIHKESNLISEFFIENWNDLLDYEKSNDIDYFIPIMVNNYVKNNKRNFSIISDIPDSKKLIQKAYNKLPEELL